MARVEATTSVAYTSGAYTSVVGPVRADEGGKVAEP